MRKPRRPVEALLALCALAVQLVLPFVHGQQLVAASACSAESAHFDAHSDLDHHDAATCSVCKVIRAGHQTLASIPALDVSPPFTRAQPIVHREHVGRVELSNAAARAPPLLA